MILKTIINSRNARIIEAGTQREPKEPITPVHSMDVATKHTVGWHSTKGIPEFARK